MTKIAIIDGHPDPDRNHFVHALADAYAEGAEGAGHEVRRITISDLEIPIVRMPETYFAEDPLPQIKDCQDIIQWADHLAIFYPLWQGMMPAYFKAFFEQVARPGFALDYDEHGGPEPLLSGRSARIFVTMGMPGVIYRWVYRAHSLKALEHSVLGFAGIGPVRHSIIGAVDRSPAHRERWLDRVQWMGAEAL